MVIEFDVFGRPATAGSKRAFYNPKSKRINVAPDSKFTVPWMDSVRAAALRVYAVAELLDGPLVLNIEFFFVRGKGDFNKKGELKNSAPAFKTTKPDLSKLARAVEDALTGIIWRDDSQICQLNINKSYGPQSMARVKIEILERSKNGLFE